MNGKPAVVLLSGLLFACVQAPPPAPPAAPPPMAVAPQPAPAPVAQPTPGNRRVGIQTARCERLLELPPDDRAAASLFYIGYQAARLRAKTINVGAIADAEDPGVPQADDVAGVGLVDLHALLRALSRRDEIEAAARGSQEMRELVERFHSGKTST